MTNISYMNDHAEFDIGFGRIKEFVDEYAEKAGMSHLFGVDYFSKLRSRIYVASFTERRDDLSQWRGYCGKSGYCIGFDRGAIEFLNNRRGFKFKNCNYRSHVSTIEELKQKIELEFDRIKNARIDAVSRNMEHALFNIKIADWICDEIPFLKDPAFEGEKEFRLVKVRDYTREDEDKGKFKYRSGNDYIVPYFDLKIDDFDCSGNIKEIIVGPGPHQDRAKRSLEQMLSDMRQEKMIDVSLSKIPLVSW